jgi:hypothetical protein
MTVVGRPDAIGTGQRDHRLLVIAVVTLVGTLSAFALIAVRQPGRLDRYTPLVSFHATLMAAWYLLVAVQSWLIVGRDRRTHRRLGLASVALATGMVVTGAIVALDFHEETGRLVTLIADLGILVNFAPLYAAGDPPEELILSQYLGPLDPTLRGPAPFAAADLERHFTLRGQTEVEEPSGPWRFSLRVRRGSSRGWRSPPSGSA